MMRYNLQQLWAMQYKLNLLMPKEQLKNNFTYVVPNHIFMKRIADEYSEQDMLKAIDFGSYYKRIIFTQIMLCVSALW